MGLAGLFLPFFLRYRGVDIEHALGKTHANSLLCEIDAFQVCFSEGHIKPGSRTVADDQQRRFTRAELNVLNVANLSSVIENCTAGQVADVTPAWFKRSALTARHLQFASHERLSVGNRIHTRELQNQKVFMRPKLFNIQFAPCSIGLQSEEPHALGKPFRNVAVNLSGHFTMPALRLYRAGNRDELAAGLRTQ